MPSWLFASLRGYDRTWLRGDVVAGLTVWAVLVPEALAYASIAGRLPRRRPVRGARRAAALRRVRQLAPPRRRARCPRPRRCRRRPSATLVAQGQPGFVGDHRRAGRHDRASSRSLAGPAAARLPRRLHLRAGAQGLHRRARADDHHRPGARSCSASRRASGDFFEQLWDLHRRTSATRAPRRSPSASSRSPSSSGCGGSRPAVPGLARRGRARRDRGRAARRSTRHGVDIVGDDRARAPAARPPRRGRAARTSTSPRARSASRSSASPRGSAPPRPTPPGTTTRSTPTAS